MDEVDHIVFQIPLVREKYAWSWRLCTDLLQFPVPSFDYQEDRKNLVYWTNKISDEGVKNYWKEKFQTSIGGKPTKIL
jgi:hypothetical protein